MKIAIIGGGISGLGAAYLLNPYHEINVYEKSDHVGGHSRTVDIQTNDCQVWVDTGFIVFNYRNYPNLTKLFELLKVPVAKSDMSFGVSIDNGWMEYGTKNTLDIFAQKRNILRASFWRLLFDILKFNRQAKEILKFSRSISLGDYLKQLNLSDWFKNYYLLAMGSSIWSMPLPQMLSFPAQTFIRFFDNHGLLTINDQPQWYTIKGGSREYVSRLVKPFLQKIKPSSEVIKIVRNKNGIDVYTSAGEKSYFDQVILACHADEALQIIELPTESEKNVLGAFSYQHNEMILHSDISFMPQCRKAWSSWNYLSDTRENRSNYASLSYWMNSLQPLNTEQPIIVTINPHRMPLSSSIYDKHQFKHPVFDEKTIVAQEQIEKIQGKERIWFCGAWQGYGFHEDGLLSAVKIAQAMNVEIPWKLPHNYLRLR